MNTQTQAIVANDTVSQAESAEAKALRLKLTSALKKEHDGGNAVRAALWAIVDAFRGDTVSQDEAESIGAEYVAARIKETSRTKYAQRFRAALTMTPDPEGEGRDRRDPLAWAGAAERAETAKAKKEAEAKARTEAVAAFENEAMQEMGLNPESLSDYRANAAEIASRAADIAAAFATKRALMDAIEAAKAGGLSLEYVNGVVAETYA